MFDLQPHHYLFILALIALIFEIFTFAFVAGTIAVGFASAGFANYLEASVSVQIISFILGCAVGFFSIRLIAEKWFYAEEVDTNSYIGREGVVIDDDIVVVSGQRWKYSSVEVLKKGESVVVVKQTGSKLIIKKL